MSNLPHATFKEAPEIIEVIDNGLYRLCQLAEIGERLAVQEDASADLLAHQFATIRAQLDMLHDQSQRLRW